MRYRIELLTGGGWTPAATLEAPSREMVDAFAREMWPGKRVRIEETTEAPACSCGKGCGLVLGYDGDDATGEE